MLINKIKRTGICLFVLCFLYIFFFGCEVVYASMLADFEDGTLNTDTGGYFREYEGDRTHGPDYQEVDVDSTQGAGATGSCMKDTVTEGNIYIIYYTSGSSRPLISQASGANRLTFYMKLPENYTLGSDSNFHVGTYTRDPINGDPFQLGSHYYHLLNIPGSSYWTKVICNTHPNHQTGVKTDPGDNPQSWNYYDGFTRFYLDMVPQSPIPLPWSGYFDEVRFYTTSEPENDETINNIACSYFGNGHFMISWHGNSQYIHNGHRYEVRYSKSPITNANYSSAAQCPGGPFSLATGAYNWIKADFTISDSTRYYFAIKDLDSSSPYVSKIDYQTDYGPPCSPTGPHITSTNISGDNLDVTLEWDANTEPDLDYYVVYWGTSSGAYTNNSGNIDKSITTYTIQDLPKDQTHFFAVTAYDNEIPSLESDYSNEVDTKAPQIISPPTVTSITDTTATIEWTTDEPGNNEVQYQYGSSSTWGWDDYLMKVTDPSMVTSHSVDIPLSTEETCYYMVGSTDAGGAGPNISDTDNNPSAEFDFFMNQDPDTDPPVITLPPTVTSITNTTAVIEWKTDEPSTSVVQYDDNSSTWGNYLWSKSDTSLVTTHSVTLTGLMADTRYYFRVGSTDGFYNGPTTSNEVNFITDTIPDTTAPVITTPPTVTGITKTSAIIEWQTDEPSNSVVEYGEKNDPPIYVLEATLGNYVTNHSVTVSGLTAGTDYDFRVSSTDAFGNGPPLKENATNPSNNYTFKTATGDDQAPVITSAPTVTNITDSTAVIEWHTDEPSSSQVQYQHQLNPGGTWGSYSLSENNAAMVTSHSVTLTGLDQNKRYYFMVGSTDAYGNGPDPTPPNNNNNPSAEQYFTTEETPDTNAPEIDPSSIKPEGITNSTAIITWHTDEPSNSMVQYGASSTWGNYFWSENDAGMVTSHNVTLTGLPPGTYYFRVGSTDASGNGPDLNSNATNSSDEYSFTTTVADDGAPVIDPSSIKPEGITNSTAIITWHTDEPSNSMVNYGASSPNWGSYDSVENDAGMVTSHSVTLTNLPPGTYYFRVGSTDAFGNGPTWNFNATNPSAEDSFTTTVADDEAPVIDPLSIKAEEITDTTATIKWDTNEFSNSMVQYGASSTWGNYTWSKNNAQMATSHSVTLTGLTKGTPYHFRVGSTDASGNGPDPTPPNNNKNPSQDEYNFTTTNNDNDPPSIKGVHIDYVNDRIDITYDEANMRNATREDNYSFSPTLSFRTAGGSDDITYTGSNTYSLFMSFIPENTGFVLTVSGITDQAGNEVYPDLIPIGIPSPAGDIREVIPHNKAGIDDSTRIPHNTSFAVRIEDMHGINTTIDPDNIKFTINDGFLSTIYDYNLGNTDVVRVVQLDPTQSPDNVTKLWVVYDRSTDYTYGPVFEFDSTVTISVDATDIDGNLMQGTYSFKVETEAQHNNAIANLPPTTTTTSLGLTTIRVDSGDLLGAQIIFDSDETVPPEFGPMNESSALSISGVDAAGVPMNLQPPTVFDNPVTIFIPCPGHLYASTLNIYRYTGTSWVLACDVSGNVQPGGEAWMVPVTREDHDNGSPSTIEIQVYHFTGVQAGFSSGSGGRSTDEVAGGGCFIATAAYGSNMDRHVKILSKFRDKHLLTNPIGRSIVEGYYKFSPSVADYLHKHPFARAVVRYALVPITGIACISLFIHPLVLLFAFIFMLLTIIYCTRYSLRSRINISQ